MADKKKLTLSIDEDVIRRAKALARRWDTSVSALVERRLRGLSEDTAEDTPLVAKLRGALPEDVDREDHRRHLEEKHSR